MAVGMEPQLQQATRVRWRPGLGVLVGVVLAAAIGQRLAGSWFDEAAVQNWSTIFIAITVQALPFLVLGVIISGAIAAFVPPGLLPSLLPRSPLLAVPTAALAGAALPGCECSSVPIAGRLVARGATPAAALAFLLSAPAINPIVLVSTAVAFPGRPEMVLARFLASLLAAVTVGLLWAWRGRDDWVAKARRPASHEASPLLTFAATAQHDFLHAGGFLVLGAAAAATLQTVVPRTILDAVADAGPWAVVALAGLAVVLAVCSEADAFVAASLTQFSATAQLAFMVVGPMVDVKLVALQTGTFGRRFAARFAPVTFVAATASASLIGWWLL